MCENDCQNPEYANGRISPNIRTSSKFPGCIPIRYVIAVLASAAMAIVYGLKVNFSVAIVGMVNNTAVSGETTAFPSNFSHAPSAQCAADEGSSAAEEDGPFLWSSTLQGTMLSAYFWGYMVSQIPGGRISELFSAKYVMLFAVSINILCTILTPAAAKFHYAAVLTIRVLEGIGGGVTFPTCHTLISKWAPPFERSIIGSIVYSGTALGTVIFVFTAGLLADAWNWEAVFYMQGGVSALWIVFWLVLVYDTPQKHPFITPQERDFIISTLHTGDNDKEPHLPFPWKSVLTSKPFWAILVANVGSMWGWYLVLTELPNYLKHVLNFQLGKSAIVTTIPFLAMWIFMLGFGKLLDALRGRNKITTTTARKIATVVATLVPAVCFVGLAYIGCRKNVAVVLVTIAVASIGVMFCGYATNHIDIAPNFAGTLAALTNTVGTISGIIVPIYTGKLLSVDPSITSWQIVFWTTVALYVIEIVVYTGFASGEEQVWNTPGAHNLEETQPLIARGNPSSQDRPSYESTNTAPVEEIFSL